MATSHSSPLEFLDDHHCWRRIHDDLWTYHVDLVLLGAHVGRRMVAVRRRGRRWALFSPVPLEDDARASLLARGDVDALVAPTAFHNTWLPESCAAFPDADVYITRGVRRDRLPKRRCLDLLDDLPSEWGDDLEPFALEGMPKVNEVVFLHAASRTLIVSDLCFHLDARYPWWTKTFLRLVGGYPGVRTTRFFRSMIADRGAFVESLDAVLERKFDRVVMSHGVVVESGGREALAGVRKVVAGGQVTNARS